MAYTQDDTQDGTQGGSMLLAAIAVIGKQGKRNKKYIDGKEYYKYRCTCHR